MKKLFLIILFICNISFSQDKFEYGATGLSDYVVTQVDSISQNVLYSKAVNWVKETYKNPEEVIIMQMENEKIRLNGFSNDLIQVKSYKFGGKYVIEIAFKEGKYKFDVLSLTNEQGNDWKSIPRYNIDKKWSRMEDSQKHIENYFNGLNTSLKNYILGKKKDDW
jgi:uncharacterized protein with gpF-like domain